MLLAESGKTEVGALKDLFSAITKQKSYLAQT
jgi:hypothetical protein